MSSLTKLKEIIRSNPEGMPNTAEALTDWLKEKRVPRTNSALQSFRAIVTKYGPDFADTVLAKFDEAMNNPAVPYKSLLTATNSAIKGEGIDFSSPISQGQIDILVGAEVFTLGEATKLKALGIWQASYGEVFNGGVEFTLSEVQNALTAIDVEDTARVNQEMRDEKVRLSRNQGEAVFALINLNPSLSRKDMVVRYATGLLSTTEVDALKTALGM